jgi:Glyoxalase-like domain
MSLQFDHLFICVSSGAPEADRLAAFGLTEGTPNTHPGQGTACRRFFFRNAYLELLWVNEPTEARSEAIRPTYLWERWVGRTKGVCPFGFIFRPARQHEGDPPFSTWEYRPPYLPASWSFSVATNAGVLTEPMLFYLAFAQRTDNSSNTNRQPVEHAAGLGEISRTELVTPHADSLSPELQAATNARLVQLSAGAEYLLELGFDGELQERTADFRPGLPLVFRW